MTREFVYEILKVATPILVVLTLASHFLFTRNGFVTRKTLQVTYIGWSFSGVSMFLLAWFSGPPSLESAILLSVGGCGIFVIFSALWAFKYFSLPYIENRIDEIREKFDEKRTKR